MTGTAQKESPTGAVGAQAGENEKAHEADDIVHQAQDHGKRFATLQARAAMAGHTLQQARSGGFILSRWGHSKHFADLDTAEALIVRMKGATP